MEFLIIKPKYSNCILFVLNLGGTKETNLPELGGTDTFDSLKARSVQALRRQVENIIGGEERIWQGSFVAGANPSFDVTPASYITSFVTEKGIIRKPFEDGIKKPNRHSLN